MWHLVQMGVNTLAWIDVKSAVSGGGPPVPMGCPFWSRPAPRPAVQPATADAASKAMSVLDPTHDISCLIRINTAVGARRAFHGFVPQALISRVASGTHPARRRLVFSAAVTASQPMPALNPFCRPRYLR